VIPSVEELKKIKYCKWHNATSHSTNECKVFRQQLQSAIEFGRIKFDGSKTQKPMKIDQCWALLTSLPKVDLVF
jgi:hypothetical protein